MPRSEADEDLLRQREAAARLRGGLSLVHECWVSSPAAPDCGFYPIICGNLRERRVRSERRNSYSERCFNTEERSNGGTEFSLYKGTNVAPLLRFSVLETVEENSVDSVLSGTSQCVVIGPGASVIVSSAGARTALGRTQLRPCAFAW